MTQKRLMSIAVLLVAVSLFASVALAHGSGDSDNHETMDVNSDLSEVRQATAKYHDVEAAKDAGYESDGHCVPNMGYHYGNMALMDGTVDPAEPEVLVYAPTGPDNEGRRLVAVEYMAAAPSAPGLFGQEFHFFAPFPPEGIDLYALHAWVWDHNPNGMFNDFNPDVECPEEDIPDGFEEGH